MKTVLQIMLFLVFMGSLAQASEHACTLRASAKVYRAGVLVDVKLQDPSNSRVVKSKNWEDCYAYALQFADQYETFLVGKSSDEDFAAYIYIKWIFDDGYLFDTTGEVTSYTKDYSSNPQKGNQKYFKDGVLF